MERVEIKQIAHVNDEGRPLCNQDGDYLHLCESDEFERLPKECRCGRCEQLLVQCEGIKPVPGKQQQLIKEISRRTPSGSWCAVIDLCKRKTEAELTLLNRSLQQLEIQGLVEMRTDNHSKSFVRLSGKANSGSETLFDVYQIGE